MHFVRTKDQRAAHRRWQAAPRRALIVDAEARAATFVLRHFGEQRPRAEHQPALNLHARMGAAGARLPFRKSSCPGSTQNSMRQAEE